MTVSGTASRTVIGAAEIERMISRLAHQIMEPQDAQGNLFIIGLRRGGEALAHRIAEKIQTVGGAAPALGFLNINLYRDDDISHALPESQIPQDVTGRTVVLIDDVLFTGRTVRAALDAVTDLGRPAAIRLCVLVDRGLRELPIQADYTGQIVPSDRSERIRVAIGRTASASDEVTVLAGTP